MILMIYIPAIGEDKVISFEVQVICLENNNKEEVLVTGNIDNVIVEGISIIISLLKQKNIDTRKYIHIHYPDYSFNREGSSAMLGTFISVYLSLAKKNIKHKIIASGELDIYGNIVGVGGVDKKYNYYKLNNYSYFFIPKSNYNCLFDNNVLAFSNIDEVIKTLKEMSINEL